MPRRIVYLAPKKMVARAWVAASVALVALLVAPASGSSARTHEEVHSIEHGQRPSDPHEVHSWRLEEDDQGIYWVSPYMNRKVREPPHGWAKNDKGQWVGPDLTALHEAAHKAAHGADHDEL